MNTATRVPNTSATIESAAPKSCIMALATLGPTTWAADALV